MKKTLVDPWFVTPPHAPDCESVVNDIANDMKINGWVGRPLLVLKLSAKEAKEFRRKKNKYYAITGSHRTAAARFVLRRIPVVVLGSRGKNAILRMWRTVDSHFFPSLFPTDLSEALYSAGCTALGALADHG